MGYRQLIRNLRLISEKICPVCKKKLKSEVEAESHCIKIGGQKPSLKRSVNDKMKTKIQILANLLQKIALWKTKMSQSHRLQEHIRMLDWVVSPYDSIRGIDDIVLDVDYQLNPEEYFAKYGGSD